MRPAPAIAVLLGCLALACGEPSATAAPSPPTVPHLDRSDAERLLIAADDARRAAWAGGGAAALVGRYSPALIAAESPRLDSLARRGGGVEEVPRERRLVHLTVNARRADGVLYVAGVQRRRSAASESAGWSAFARQWEVQFVNPSGAWLVEQAQDLPPERWWH